MNNSPCVGTISTQISQPDSTSRCVVVISSMLLLQPKDNWLRLTAWCCQYAHHISAKCSHKCQPINMHSVNSPEHLKNITRRLTEDFPFTVFLKDVSSSALKDLIQFMYCGEVNVKQEALPAFISTAEALQIKGLTESVRETWLTRLVNLI